MIKKIKNLLTTAAISSMLLVPVLGVASVGAQAAGNDANIQNSLCTGTELKTNATTCAQSTSGAGDNVNSLVADVINIFSWVVGIVSVIMIIVGGFQYITSGGASDKVSTAKNTIMYAIIGLVIVALAQFIVRFVLQRVTV